MIIASSLSKRRLDKRQSNKSHYDIIPRKRRNSKLGSSREEYEDSEIIFKIIIIAILALFYIVI